MTLSCFFADHSDHFQGLVLLPKFNKSRPSRAPSLSLIHPPAYRLPCPTSLPDFSLFGSLRSFEQTPKQASHSSLFQKCEWQLPAEPLSCSRLCDLIHWNVAPEKWTPPHLCLPFSQAKTRLKPGSSPLPIWLDVTKIALLVRSLKACDAKIILAFKGNLII